MGQYFNVRTKEQFESKLYSIDVSKTSYDSTLEAFKIQDDLTNRYGMIRIKLGKLYKGDIIEIECELCSLNGDVPQILCNNFGDNYEGGSVENLITLSPSKIGQFELKKAKLVVNKTGLYAIRVGTGITNTGTFLIRNIKVKTENNELPTYEQRIENFVIKGNQNGYSIDSEGYLPSNNYSINATTSGIVVTLNTPFSYKRGIAYVQVSGESNRRFTAYIKEIIRTGFTIVIYDNDNKTYQDPTTLTSLLTFYCTQIGYDYTN